MTITNLTESKIKAKDLGLLFAVERALGQQGLDAEIVGSVAKGAKEGRGYRDIDLKVAYDNTNSRYGGLCKFVRAASQTSSQSPEVAEASQEIGRMLGAATTLSLDPKMQGIRYMHMSVEQRFQIRRGRTTIDLCFEGQAPIVGILHRMQLERDNFAAYRKPLLKYQFVKLFHRSSNQSSNESSNQDYKVRDPDGKVRVVRRRT